MSKNKKYQQINNSSYSSNLFIQSGSNSPLNTNNSIDFYITITFGNGTYLTRKCLDYSNLITQLQIDLSYYGNKALNIIIELDRLPLKKRTINEVLHQSENHKYYIVSYCGIEPNKPFYIDDIVTLLSSIKEFLSSNVKRYDYIVICNLNYSKQITNDFSVIMF